MSEKIYDVRVGYYKIRPESLTNIYGDNEKLFYYRPIWIPAWVTRNDYSYQTDNNMIDYNQTAKFSFLLDILLEKNLFIEIGDVVEYNQEFYTIDTKNEKKFIGDINPHKSENSNYGYNVSIVCDAHLTNRSKIGIEEHRPSNNKINNLPKNV